MHSSLPFMTKSVGDNVSLILLNDFKLQWKAIREDFLQSVARVGESGYLILGSEVQSFESDLSRYWGLNYAVGCANGLDAIEIGLRTLNLKPGQKVITTPLSAFATTLAILRAGGIPVFCDVDDSGLLDLELVENILFENQDIKFLLPVHLYGQALNLKKLQRLKEVYSLNILEDCAQAIGSKSFGRPTGSVGQVAATSFYPTKNLGCYGDGGALLTNTKEIADAAKCIRDYGQTQKYTHSVFGLNSRLDELQAAVLRTALLPRLAEWSETRKQIAAYYQKYISSSHIKLLPTPEGTESSWHLFPIEVISHRENLMNYLRNSNISSGIHYPGLIPDQPIFNTESSQYRFEIKTELTRAHRFTRTQLSLPIHPFLKEEEIRKIVNVCNSWKP